MAKDAPNPNAKPEDPTTDPAAAAKRDNDMEKASAAKADAKEAPKKASLAQREEGEWVTAADEKAASDAVIARTKVESVAGPPGAPIGYGVHKLAIEGGNPYAGKQIYRAPEPENGIQHQPIILPPGTAPAAPPAPKLDADMQYRRDVGETGVRAEDANLDKLIAAGMNDQPKVRFSNSILDDVAAKEEAADKAKNASVKADPNSGAPPADTAETNPVKAKKALERMAKDAPNPNAKPEDPTTDPAAAAKRDNDMEKASAAKAEAKETKKAALAQWVTEEDEKAASDKIIARTSVESVKGPPGAPIGYGVHALSIEGGNPYAAKQIYRAEEPARGVQHQPVMLPADYYRGPQPKADPLSPEMQYRKDVGETGVRAADASYKDLVAAGMTDTPKVRYNNSITAEQPAAAPEG